MSDNHHTHDYDENDLIDSPLSQVLQEHNQHVEILRTYRDDRFVHFKPKLSRVEGSNFSSNINSSTRSFFKVARA